MTLTIKQVNKHLGLSVNLRKDCAVLRICLFFAILLFSIIFNVCESEASTCLSPQINVGVNNFENYFKPDASKQLFLKIGLHLKNSPVQHITSLSDAEEESLGLSGFVVSNLTSVRDFAEAIIFALKGENKIAPDTHIALQFLRALLIQEGLDDNLVNSLVSLLPFQPDCPTLTYDAMDSSHEIGLLHKFLLKYQVPADSIIEALIISSDVKEKSALILDLAQLFQENGITQYPKTVEKIIDGLASISLEQLIVQKNIININITEISDNIKILTDLGMADYFMGKILARLCVMSDLQQRLFLVKSYAELFLSANLYESQNLGVIGFYLLAPMVESFDISQKTQEMFDAFPETISLLNRLNNPDFINAVFDILRWFPFFPDLKTNLQSLLNDIDQYQAVSANIVPAELSHFVFERCKIIQETGISRISQAKSAINYSAKKFNRFNPVELNSLNSIQQAI